MRIVLVGNFFVSYSSESQHANTLEGMGHIVDRLQEGKVTSEQILARSRNAGMLVFIHTHGWVTPGKMKLSDVFKELKSLGIPTVTYHLDLWFGLKRQEDLENDDFYRSIEYFFTVDKQMAEWFNENTEVKGIYLPAAVYGKEAIKYPNNRLLTDVMFVGSKNYHPEWQYRPELINFLERRFGNHFKHVGPGGKYGVVRGLRLNKVYAETKVVVGDSLCLDFEYPYYWSDRVYETIGRGGFIIHPYIKGMEDHFEDGKHLVFYKFGDFEELTEKIDYYLAHGAEREAIRKAGHDHVKQNHTYANRWEFILNEVKKND